MKKRLFWSVTVRLKKSFTTLLIDHNQAFHNHKGVNHHG